MAKSLWGGIVGCMLLCASGTSSAEVAAPAAPEQLAEVIVTAEKRAERLNDVPLSVTAATGDELVRAGVSSAADLEKVVPGFIFAASSYGSPIYSIRGVGFYDDAMAISPAVSVYVDQIPLPFPRMTEGATLDLERVEVLKGPQGTLFGQNSTGGAVNYIAAKPTSSFAAGGDLAYGRFNEVDVGGFVSGPVATGLNARLAVRSETRDDWQVSNTRNDTIGKRNFQAARLLLDWHPIDPLSIELNVNGWLDKSDTQMGQARAYLPVSGAPPLTPVTLQSATNLINYPYLTKDSNRIADWNAAKDFGRNDRFYQFAARVDYEATSSLRLVSISSYSNLRVAVPVDADSTPVSALFV